MLLAVQPVERTCDGPWHVRKCETSTGVAVSAAYQARSTEANEPSPSFPTVCSASGLMPQSLSREDLLIA